LGKQITWTARGYGSWGRQITWTARGYDSWGRQITWTARGYDSWGRQITWTARGYDSWRGKRLLQLFLLFPILGSSVLEPDLESQDEQSILVKCEDKIWARSRLRKRSFIDDNYTENYSILIDSM
jgi:hypothetical protein